MSTRMSPVLFAAVGDVHGSQHAMVELLMEWEKQHRQSLAFVLQLGDFEAVRDVLDLASLPGPQRYRKLGDFADFHDDRAEFPWPVWFIAGNHEPFELLATMPKGGSVARNCHYLGRAGRMGVEGIRLAWLGGISTAEGPLAKRPSRDWKQHAYFTERDVDRALSDGKVDILLLHEWPLGAAAYPHETAGRRRSGGAQGPGNETARLLVDLLQPQLALAGHTHWGHRSRLSEQTSFVGLGHVDKGREAFAVFLRDEQGEIVEIPN
jgi:lariat debranching enzyme